MRLLKLTSVVSALVLTSTLALAAGKPYEVKIEGMHCAPCAKAVKDALSKIEGIDENSVEVTIKKNKATFTVENDDAAMTEKVQKAIEDQGYKVSSINGKKVATKD